MPVTKEITVIPQLLDMPNVKECIVTADAIECQKEVIRKIEKKEKASYVGAFPAKKRNRVKKYETMHRNVFTPSEKLDIAFQMLYGARVAQGN